MLVTFGDCLMKTKKLLLLSLFLVNISYALDNIDPLNAFKMQSEKKAIIIDVREENETSQGKIKDAYLFPLSQMEMNKQEYLNKVAEIKKNQTLIVYCRSGRRSGIVGNELEKKGLKVLNLGAFDSWKSKGLPTQ